jgi:hypothetical protein
MKVLDNHIARKRNRARHFRGNDTIASVEYYDVGALVALGIHQLEWDALYLSLVPVVQLNCVWSAFVVEKLLRTDRVGNSARPRNS